MKGHLSQPSGLEPIETASRDELTALQTTRLQWTLSHVYDNVPRYRAKFDAAGVHPSDLKSLSDLAKFPFTTKQDLRENYPFGLIALPREQIARVHASSGTTGRPTVVAYSKRDLDMWADVMARSMRAAGCRPGMMVHIAFGYGLFTGGLGAHGGAERLGCMVAPVSGGMTERQAQLIADFKPDIVMSTPSYMLAILDEMRRVGGNPRKSSLKIGMFGAEPWTNAMRQELESELDIDALDLYGLSEVIGPGVASECVETKDGPTLWEDHFYPEVVDPATGAPVADGEHGEIVLHLAHQGGDADHPLPHARPDAPVAGNRPHDAQDGEDRRPLRRHDHPARRQRVSQPDRGADPQMPGSLAPLRHRTRPRWAARYDERSRRGALRRARFVELERNNPRSSSTTSKPWWACRFASMWSIPAPSIARSARPSACWTCGPGTSERRVRTPGKIGLAPLPVAASGSRGTAIAASFAAPHSRRQAVAGELP